MRAFSVAFGAKTNLDVAPSCAQRREVNGSERRKRNGRSKRRGNPTRGRILRTTACARMRREASRVMRALAVATRRRGQLMRRIWIRLHVRADRLRVRMTIQLWLVIYRRYTIQCGVRRACGALAWTIAIALGDGAGERPSGAVVRTDCGRMTSHGAKSSSISSCDPLSSLCISAFRLNACDRPPFPAAHPCCNHALHRQHAIHTLARQQQRRMRRARRSA